MQKINSDSVKFGELFSPFAVGNPRRGESQR